MKTAIFFSTCFIIFSFSLPAQTTIESSRLGEVFQQTILVSGPITSPAANRLYDPWEITYGPDDSLWVTEARGYKVKKIHPDNAGQRTILNLTDAASGGTFTPTSWRRQFAASQNPWPQGGMMGLAIHPDFNHPVTPKKYVYIAYVHSYIGQNLNNPNNGEFVNGHLFMTRLVRFTYESGTLGSPVALCDTIVGSNDHNSGRLIIANVSGAPFLFYAVGDMGAGQFANLSRNNKSQILNSYEGKILRFNLEPDGDPGSYDQWIPDDNPYNIFLGVESAVWSTGIRNNQGFAYDAVLNKLYGSSHGPFSDDELNVIETGKNYGHPQVIGYSADGNYNNAKAGPSGSSLPLIVSEAANATSIGASYKDPLYSFYNPPAGNASTLWSIQYIYTNQNYTSADGPSPWGLAQNVNIWWRSEAVSGIDIYTNSRIPGWKNSLLSACLKGGRIIRTKLDAAGDNIVPVAGGDTITHFRSVNRFRDIAVSPDGKDIFVVIDSSSVTSGPTTTNPMISACRGCLQKYTFLGYSDVAGKSDISTAIDVTSGTVNACTNGTSVTIDNTNNNLWVPITGPDGNIMAEIKANGQNLGLITSSFYIHGGPGNRTQGANRYLNRNITIIPQVQPSSPVGIRLYFSKTEYDALDLDPLSGISAIGDMRILKNNDPCASAVLSNCTLITPAFAEAHGANGYMLQANISSFSSFYFGSANLILPASLLSFTGNLQTDKSVLLKWKTESEYNVRDYTVERSLDGTGYLSIGSVAALNNAAPSDYAYTDLQAAGLASVLYYRLRITDNDGTYKYSPVLAVSDADITGKVIVSPNPVTHTVNVSINAPANGKINWKLIDMTGRAVMQQSLQVRKGPGNIVSIDMSSYAGGIYYLNLNGAGINQNLKLQKL
jgi:PQQ-dependent dehydrogenase (s-GDH family)